jgi:hypothetical protein
MYKNLVLNAWDIAFASYVLCTLFFPEIFLKTGRDFVPIWKKLLVVRAAILDMGHREPKTHYTIIHPYSGYSTPYTPLFWTVYKWVFRCISLSILQPHLPTLSWSPTVQHFNLIFLFLHFNLFLQSVCIAHQHWTITSQNLKTARQLHIVF